MSKKICFIAGLVLFWGIQALGETLVIKPTEMEGKWKLSSSYGAGEVYLSDGTALKKTVRFEGGEYKVYIRSTTSSITPSDMHIYVNDRLIVVPVQGPYLKTGWIRAGTVRIPAGKADIRVEPPARKQSGSYNFGVLAFSSDSFTDWPGRCLEFVEYTRREVARMSTPVLLPPRDAKEADFRLTGMRVRMLRTLGLDPMPPRTPLNPIKTGTIDKGDYVIEKVAFESQPNHVVPALLYLPKNILKPLPAVVSVIGHFSYGKSSDRPQRRAIALVKRGYAVLAFDPCYAWERQIPGNSEAFDPVVSGGTINGHEVWDIVRAVDYLETRKEVDANRIGLTGCSGGGMQTLYGGAIETRFKAVVPAVGVWAVKDIVSNWGFSADNWVAGLLQIGDSGVLLSLTAPRALLVLSVDSDYGSLEGTHQQYLMAYGFYKALGAEKKIAHFTDKGGHDYTQRMREAMYSFMDLWVKGTGDGTIEPEPDVEKDMFPTTSEELLVFGGKKIPTEGAATVNSIWKDRALQLRSELLAKNKKLSKATLHRNILKLPPPMPPVDREVNGGLLITTEAGIEVAAKMVGSGDKAIVWISEKDVLTEAKSEVVQALAKEATVLVVEPRCISEPADRHLGWQGAMLMDRPIIGMWTYDVLCAVDYLMIQRGFKSVSIAASGQYSSLVGLFVAVLNPGVEKAAIDGLLESFVSVVGGDEILQIHGILKVADIEQMVADAGPDRLKLNNLRPAGFPTAVEGTSMPVVEFMTETFKLKPE